MKRTDDARSCFLAFISQKGLNAETAYNLACVESLAGCLADGLRYLPEAVGLGFRNRESLLKDPDLAAVRGLPGFAGVMSLMP